ncbi:peptidoglycan-binding protein [Streptomyces sp. WI04-05B]|uniref:peptidoglycan-binding protein n=1 Tax=Streptomyces TaxID=1883 RepID=UPI0029ACD5DD|nr:MULTISPECIES: peptidoglycan-binding protein [unclassified Streptomyces]MDX2549142.1 peptidoglycan-binding protein [Streptomyces sp. WI04-05B]MDX2582028.1 peptidoglycan-binding protein [Streptomyces sp. WI04-05A]MDX3752440.1 peptidoglycan-binding protein [Streptomyces sp. AK08-02]
MATKSGPQRYPGASRANWYQDDHPGDPMQVNVLVLHTTEGRTLPTYSGGSMAPNLTAVPDLTAKKLKWYQHFDIETSSRALANQRGGVETNTLNVTQVELVGTCDPRTHKKWTAAGDAHIYWPDAPDWALRSVARFLAWMHEEHGVPLAGPKSWPAYPTSYGDGGGQRMSFTDWKAFKGVCGHMHVPENDHGDPGAIDFSTLVKYAKAELDVDDSADEHTPPQSTPKPRVPAYPGRKYFKEGAVNPHVLKLGKQLVKRGFGDHYKVGPSRSWGESDRLNVRDFQKSRKELRGDADGYPGPLTWRLLFT